jgi:hypothetical protein
MNENQSTPPPEIPEPKPAPPPVVVTPPPEPVLTFEWHESALGPPLDASGEAVPVETRHQAAAVILAPKPGQVIQEPYQSFVRWRQAHAGGHYVLLKRDDGYVALRSDVAVGPREATRVELRAVNLDGPQPALGWEVYTQGSHGVWEPVEGQHLHPRTASAGKWLDELENIVLPKLIAQRTEVVAQYHKAATRSPVACHPEGRPLNYDTALSLTRNAVLGCNYDEAHAMAYSAELQLQAVTARLREHVEAGHRLGLSRYTPWVGLPRWHQSIRHRSGVKQASEDWTRAVEKVRELQSAAESPRISERIERGAKELLAAQTWRREADRAVRKVAAAQQLIAELRQRPGALITLEQTLIQGRRAQTVPQWPAAERLSPRFNQTPTVRAHTRRL